MTHASDDDLIESLRVVLYALLNKPEAAEQPRTLRHWGAVFRSFCHRSRMDIPPIAPHQQVFLFQYATGSNILNLRPVAEEAKRRGLLGGIVAGEIDPDPLRSLGPVVSERDLSGLAGASSFANLWSSARLSYHRLLTLLQEKAPSWAEIVRRHHGYVLRNLIWSRRMQFAYARLLSAWRPSVVISTSDYWPGEFQFFCQAKKLGIPNAMIQHGEFTSPLAWPTYADTFLVWGEVFRDKLLNLGAPSSRLRVCGMPAGDDSFHRLQSVTPKPLGTPPVCLLFSHAHDRFDDPDLFRAFGGYLKQAIQLSPRVRWQIKLHPAEDDSFYREIGLVGHPQVEILPKSVSLDAAVEAADVACTIRSTAGLQAMMMQRPLLVIDLKSHLPNSVWWPQHGGGLSAGTAEVFARHLLRLAGEIGFRDDLIRSQNGFLNHAFANRGRAASSVVDYLEEQTHSRDLRSADGALRAASGS